jgi:hypothetical protein
MAYPSCTRWALYVCVILSIRVFEGAKEAGREGEGGREGGRERESGVVTNSLRGSHLCLLASGLLKASYTRSSKPRTLVAQGLKLSQVKASFAVEAGCRGLIAQLATSIGL